jgi:beta-carotene 3-hydroxylase
MIVLEYFGTTLITFLLMECVTWLTHKYVMHGFLWYLHEDHHQPKYLSIFEKNDLFFVIFAIPSITLFYFGINPTLNFMFFIGLGILFYGIAYFFVHDIIIHQRIKWFNRTKIKYFVALRKAHKMHHKHLDKPDGECFGMLFVPIKYFKI